MPEHTEAEVQHHMNGRADEANPALQGSPTANGDAEDIPALVLTLTHELLERDDITLDDDFFSAGGDSVVAMHLVGQLARRTGLRLRVSLLFANPLLRDFTAQIQRVRAETAAAATVEEPAGPLAAALGADGGPARAW